MSNKIDITMAANSNEVQRALDRMGDTVDKATAKFERMEKSGKRGARTTGNEFRGVGQSITDMAAKAVTGFGAMTTAASVFHTIFRSIVKEAEEARRRQRESLVTTVDVGKAVRKTREAFSEDATLKEHQLEDVILGISERTNAAPASIARALQTAFSAKGDLPASAAVNAVEKAFALDPSDEAQATVVAGRALDVAKFSGTDDARVNLGFIQNTQEASRVTSVEKVGQNLLPTINNLTPFGDTQEQAAELVTAITQLLGDEEGTTSATAAMQLGGQLKNFFPKRGTKGELKGRLVGKDDEGEFAIPDEQFERLRAAKSTAERISVLQESPELRRGFIGGSSFKVKAEQAILGILRGTKVATDALAKTQQTIRGTATPEEKAFQAKLFEAELKTKREGKLQATVTAQEQFATSRQRAQIRDPFGARMASAREIFQQVLKDVDLPGIDSFEIHLPFVDNPDLGRRANLNKFLRQRENRLGQPGGLKFAEDPAIYTLRELLQKSDERKIGEKYRTFVRGSAEERSVLDAISALETQKKEAQAQIEREEARKDRADELLRQHRQKAGLPEGFIGPVSPQQMGINHAEMAKQTELLQRLVDAAERPQPAAKPAATPPKVRTPRSASLSRRNQ